LLIGKFCLSRRTPFLISTLTEYHSFGFSLPTARAMRLTVRGWHLARFQQLL
jgi:hypothetical protein